jgi:hypothetical protein|tara:strand:- start:13570 stop:13686 length:117 start_codon:yes stop_codon:yes gene_type:complete
MGLKKKEIAEITWEVLRFAPIPLLCAGAIGLMHRLFIV